MNNYNTNYCPRCNKFLKNKYDYKMIKIMNSCFDCVINFEHKLRVNNLYQLYEDYKIKQNSLSIFKETLDQLIEFKKQQEEKPYEEIITSQGEIFKYYSIYFNGKEDYFNKLNQIIDDIKIKINEIENELKNNNKYKIIEEAINNYFNLIDINIIIDKIKKGINIYE